MGLVLKKPAKHSCDTPPVMSDGRALFHDDLVLGKGSVWCCGECSQYHCLVSTGLGGYVWRRISNRKALKLIQKG